ncbi:hypothetical protein V6N13_047134 [Hibiscus sabdariffa]|uniref:Uncharacterized protein n=1 Tax=Hibiscus sabdariffa TaxID=183260 RepID=A0ABR2F345_9ROSI
MEYVNGIRIIVTNAGIACLMSSHSTSTTDLIISTPTSISGGPTAQAGIDANNGVKKNARKKYPATVKAVNPVLPPSLIPVEDSMNAVTGDVPRSDPATMEAASDRKAKYWPSKLPFSSVKPANCAIEYNVPVVSNMSTYRNVTNASQKYPLFMCLKFKVPAVVSIK